MKLLLDQGLPRSAASLLQQAGHDALHCSDVGLQTALDPEILAAAKAEERIVVALDADFHALLATSGARRPSVIRIRIEGLKGPQAAELLSRVLDACGEELERGAAVSVEATRLRVHILPIEARRSGQ